MKKYYEEVRHEQLVAIDNKGNFQTISPSKRGHVLKYGRDLASIIGTVTAKAVARERFLVLKE